MTNYARLCKWVKSLPKTSPIAQIYAFRITCNNKKMNQKYSPSFFPFGIVRPVVIVYPLRHQRILGKV